MARNYGRLLFDHWTRSVAVALDVADDADVNDLDAQSVSAAGERAGVWEMDA